MKVVNMIECTKHLCNIPLNVYIKKKHQGVHTTNDLYPLRIVHTVEIVAKVVVK